MTTISLVITAVAVGALALQGPSQEELTRRVVERFNDALNRQDLAAVVSLLHDDTVFENTSPQPDGTRYVGREAVAAFWQTWVAANAGARFDVEEMIVSGDRCVVRWVYRKQRDGTPWHLRGVDVFTVRDGKILAKLSYVKG